MAKGDIEKKISGYVIYKPVGKKKLIKHCHRKTGYAGKYIEKSKGKWIRVKDTMVCHKTKATANKHLKELQPTGKKIKITKTWALVKNPSGKWTIKQCNKHYEKGKLVRLYNNGKVVEKRYKCYTKKSDATKRAITANFKDAPKRKQYKVRGVPGVVARQARHLKQRPVYTSKLLTKKRYTAFGAKKTKKTVVWCVVKNKNGYRIRKCHKTTVKGKSVKLFLNGKKVPKSVTCYRLKSSANKKLTSLRKFHSKKLGKKVKGWKKTSKGKWTKIEKKKVVKKKVVKKKKSLKVKKGWAVVKNTSGRWSVRRCLSVGGKRMFSNKKSVPSKFKCYRLKSKATKIVKNKNKKSIKRRVTKRKVTKIPVAKKVIISRRHTAFGSRRFSKLPSMAFGRRMNMNYGFGSRF